MDEPYYVGWHVAGQDIGLDTGAERIQDIKDVGAGKLVASVRDPDGNPIGLIQPA